MAIEPIKDQLQAIQLKYSALNVLKDIPDPLHADNLMARPSSTLIQFTARKKPRPSVCMEIPPEKSEAIQSKMLARILDKYGKNGIDILSPSMENLLSIYIEAYVLRLEAYVLNQKITDPKDDTHILRQIVREAGETIIAELNSKPRFAKKGMHASSSG